MIDDTGFILELNNVTKKYHNGNFGLNNVSIRLPYGAIMGFVGENGAGKTTTINCILDILKIESGEIKIFGKNNSDFDSNLREKLGIVFDSNTFSKSLTAKNISQIMKNIYKAWNNKIFFDYLDKFEMPINQRIATFSKGMLMKLSLSVALSHSPELLILDEVTSGLDPIIRDDVLDILMNFIQDEKHSVFLSSHISSDLEKIADYLTFINKGNILLSVSKEEMVNNFGIIRCKKEQFSQIQGNIVSYLKRDYQIDVLVSNIGQFKGKYNNFICDKANIDEILSIMVKGEKYERTIV